MATWVNHVVIAAARNGTLDHTIDPAATGTVVAGSAFTPTAGRFLIVLVNGAVTSTTPSGWTLPTNGSSLGGSGLYVWHRDAAGSDTFTTTHNGSNYPAVFDIYEFPAGSTFIACVSDNNVTNGQPGPDLTGLTGVHWDAGASGQGNDTGSTYTYTWDAGVEQADFSVITSGTDGYTYGLTSVEDSVTPSRQLTATSTRNETLQRLVFAVDVEVVVEPLIVTQQQNVFP